jgi:hypothetical protein
LSLRGRKYLYNDELRVLHFSPNTIRIVISGTIGWTGHVARRGKKGNECKALVGGTKETAIWKT